MTYTALRCGAGSGECMKFVFELLVFHFYPKDRVNQRIVHVRFTVSCVSVICAVETRYKHELKARCINASKSQLSGKPEWSLDIVVYTLDVVKESVVF